MNTQKVIDLASDLHPSMLLSRWPSDYLLLRLVLGVLKICARGHLDENIITIITFTGTGSRYVTDHLVWCFSLLLLGLLLAFVLAQSTNPSGPKKIVKVVLMLMA